MARLTIGASAVVASVVVGAILFFWRPEETVAIGQADPLAQVPTGANREQATGQRVREEEVEPLRVPVEELESNPEDPVDEGIAATESALQTMLTPSGRASIRENTRVDQIAADAELNPRGISLNSSEQAELQGIVSAFDKEIEDARYFQACESYRALNAAIKEGRARPLGRDERISHSEIAAQHGGLASIATVPGPEGKTNRLVVLTPATNPEFFDLRRKVKELKERRRNAISVFFASR